MSRRRNEGAETFARLLDWTRGQTAAERLAAQILRVDGFRSVDPSHPLGGPDGLKDMICERGDKKWIGGVYFPRSQQPFNAIAEKFKHDILGVESNKVDGFVFITNQELRLREREELKSLAGTTEVEILHLERIASMLDSPQCYGIRLEFLDIEMTKEEQLAFIAARDSVIEHLQTTLDAIVSKLQNLDLADSQSLDQIRTSIPLSEIREFKSILESIAGYNPYSFTTISFGGPAHIRNLQVPLHELKEFADILDRIAGHQGMLAGLSTIMLSGVTPGHVSKLHVPLSELREFAGILDRIAGSQNLLGGIGVLSTGRPGHVRDLHVPLEQLHQYEAALDRVIQKLQEVKRLGP